MMLVRALGAEKMKEALEYLDKITKDAGFPGVHLQFPIGWASQPSAIPSNPKPNRNEFFKYFFALIFKVAFKPPLFCLFGAF